MRVADSEKSKPDNLLIQDEEDEKLEQVQSRIQTLRTYSTIEKGEQEKSPKAKKEDLGQQT